MTRVTGLHHVSLSMPPEDYAKTLCFYRDFLGLEMICEAALPAPDPLAMLTLGNTILELVPDGSGGASSGVLNHIALATDDVDGLLEKVRAAGYEITMDPAEFMLPHGVAIRIAFFAGPAGESVELLCEH
jgi:glyoxylase I family protein